MEAGHYKKLILDGIKKNIIDENILFYKHYNNTCLIVILTIIISINKILKYFNIFIWKIDYSPLRKLTSNKWSDNLLLLGL